jgi:preprotein translocase SecE subunit
VVNKTMDKNDGPSARARSADLPEASEADLAAESDEVEAQDLALSPVDAERDELSLADGGYGARPITRSSASLSVPAWANANPITRYFYECFIELRKTTWPANNETWTMTLIVIGMSIGVAILLGAADYGFNFLVHWVLTLSGK